VSAYAPPGKTQQIPKLDPANIPDRHGNKEKGEKGIRQGKKPLKTRKTGRKTCRELNQAKKPKVQGRTNRAVKQNSREAGKKKKKGL